MGRCLGEDLADFDAALAVLGKLEWRGQCAAGGPLGGEIPGRQRLAFEFLKGRLRIERIDLRRSAVEVDVHDPLRTRREVRHLRGERIA